jgi:NADPH-dependent 2,4-dienoyl-CoA reductase/sulfur reductase-like enzyme
MLRHEGYSRSITMLSDDDAPPCDRPNLSKDYLAGNAPEESIPLRPPEFYDQHDIELRLGTRVVAIHANARELELANGSRQGYGALLLATGAEPVRLGVPGSKSAAHPLSTHARGQQGADREGDCVTAGRCDRGQLHRS